MKGAFFNFIYVILSLVLEKLKVIMEDIENNIMTFKEAQREK